MRVQKKEKSCCPRWSMDLSPRAWKEVSDVFQLMERTGSLIPKGQRTHFFRLREYPFPAHMNHTDTIYQDALTPTYTIFPQSRSILPHTDFYGPPIRLSYNLGLMDLWSAFSPRWKPALPINLIEFCLIVPIWRRNIMLMSCATCPDGHRLFFSFISARNCKPLVYYQ